MEKLKMHSPDLAASNVEKIAVLFPNCITEAKDSGGKVVRAVDIDLLKQELTGTLVEGPQERYRLDWPGKREAILAANAPIAKSLRPSSGESEDFEKTRNILIEGDNLEALKLLQETYLRKVKMIYIDPPYNIGGDFVYNDDFVDNSESFLLKSNQKDESGNRLVQNTETNGRFHSDWLSMIYARLSLAKDLLSEDGVIVISIDENENANLRKICDLVFGAKNFAGEIIWKNSSKNDQDYISIQHEYIVIYVKNKAVNKGRWLEKKQGLESIYKAFESFKLLHKNDWPKIHDAAVEWFEQFPESNPIKSSKHYSWMDERGVYFPDNISGPNHGQYVYDVIHPITNLPCKPPASGWRYPKETMLQRINLKSAVEGLVFHGKC
jgi:adenine-specific DNA-methyltransferase